MENAKYTYDVFIDNGLDSTSHSLQWLPNWRHDSHHFAQFNVDYFLYGTHLDEDHPSSQTEKLIIGKIRVPKYS